MMGRVMSSFVALSKLKRNEVQPKSIHCVSEFTNPMTAMNEAVKLKKRLVSIEVDHLPHRHWIKSTSWRLGTPGYCQQAVKLYDL